MLAKAGLRLRLITGFAVFIVLTAAFSGMAVRSMYTLSRQTAMLYRHPFAVSTAVLRIDTSIAKIRKATADIVLARDYAEIEVWIQDIKNAEDAVSPDLEIIKERFLGEKKKVVELERLFTEWKAVRDPVIREIYQGDREAALAVLRKQEAGHVRLLDEKMNEFNAFASGKASEFYETSMELRGMTLKAFGLFMGIEEIAAQANALRKTMAFFTLSRDNNVAEIHAVSVSRKEVAA